MRRQRGISLLETVLGLFVVFVLAVAVASVSSHSLILDRAIWERRLALKVIETQLEAACNEARTTAGFNGLADQVLVAADFPGELTAATGARTVQCVDGTLAAAPCTDLKRVRIRVEWSTRAQKAGLAAGRVDESSEAYLISRMGICGVGT